LKRLLRGGYRPARSRFSKLQKKGEGSSSREKGGACYQNSGLTWKKNFIGARHYMTRGKTKSKEKNKPSRGKRPRYKREIL